MVSDETAYRKYLAGDEAAAQLLVERYGDALTLYINGVLGDIHEAEDLMIEAFAHIFARERPIQDGCFKAYLYKTGRNLALRCKTRRRFFLPLEELPFELPDEALAETGSLQNEQHQQLYAALGKLKKEYRETLFLVYFEELSYRQAAQVLGRTEQQVTNLVYRGKQQLKQLLEQEGYQYENRCRTDGADPPAHGPAAASGARTADAADRCRLYGGLSGAGGLPGPCHARLGRHIGRAACFPHRHRRDAE
ncbi:sigma-70 family RNA polymerase sigma factor [Faecalibacterium sp. CLA-AA-H254]|nr:sigma-70 family RNA polymerase sigma factor [Faecalibacterium hominis (ex Afrizal et al. 2022)]MCC2121901.1 sigma-70 family RNA polymerase sigma factor [Faecalibacterium hominis (ex Afrizal et al. 2022)]